MTPHTNRSKRCKRVSTRHRMRARKRRGYSRLMSYMNQRAFPCIIAARMVRVPGEA